MRRTATTIAMLALSTAALTACGDDSTTSVGLGGGGSEYCAAAMDMGNISMTTDTTPEELLEKAKKVLAVAPSEIKSDWEAFVAAQETAADATANIPSPDDFANPEEAMAQIENMQKGLENMGDGLVTATQNIQQHLTENCN